MRKERTNNYRGVILYIFSGKILIGKISTEDTGSSSAIFTYKAEMVQISENSITLPTIEECEEWIEKQFTTWLVLANLMEIEHVC